MPRLIWVFNGHTCPFFGFVMLQLIFSHLSQSAISPDNCPMIWFISAALFWQTLFDSLCSRTAWNSHSDSLSADITLFQKTYWAEIKIMTNYRAIFWQLMKVTISKSDKSRGSCYFWFSPRRFQKQTAHCCKHWHFFFLTLNKVFDLLLWDSIQV